MKDIKIDMPDYARQIIERLNDHGYEAYVVGGCVRDQLIGREPNDWDITTSALPQQVKKLFGKTIDTGLQHGTVTIMIGKEPIEVTTYRIDGKYEDNRRPKSVAFTNQLVEDLRRRDFTINAMAYHHKEGLVDAFHGVADLEQGIIRCVGNPHERFNEDALRMLRAIRFAAQLDYALDEATGQAITDLADLIRHVSMERVHVELNKLLISNHPMRFMDIHRYGLMPYVMPEFLPCIGNHQHHPYHHYPIGEHIMRSVEAIRAEKTLRWTMLLHDIGKPEKKTTDEDGIDHFYGHEQLSADMAYAILNRLKFDKKTLNRIVALIACHDIRVEDQPKRVRRAVNKIGTHLFDDFLAVQEADMRAQHPDKLEERLIVLDKVRAIWQRIQEEGQCVTIKDLKINGRDLINHGFKEGKEIGDILQHLLNKVIEEPALNNRDMLLEILETLKK
ncbi:CCA tRNA nucleotidyltransferase [Vallitalea pronyensis]|uniref:CCA tRNA nucleotidyltransferase n=1 Tax=Vallitalea pronyensis TaxID=1348613 RepID=A0A8J8MGV6_9FIRM|nr:CCA tRNA nucleotidyltransferase [Vallitalea pronyensis]QUI21364.1 CCA tRNA nucleotidyltransferase [Vallitalea pronyensis]